MLGMIGSLSGASAAATLTYTTSWIGNTYGYGDGHWVPCDVRAIYVKPDGTVYSNAPWDESGAEISIFKDGVALGNAGHTHGWGNEGGDAITGNARYLYAAVRVGNEGGHLKLLDNWPDKGKVWYGVTRRAMDDVESGQSFQGGRGNFGSKVSRSFLAINEVADAPETVDVERPYVTGLTANNQELFVSNYLRNRIEVYDAETMQKKREWPLPHPQGLALAADGHSIWAIHETGINGGKSVDRYDGTGRHMQSLILPSGANPSAIVVDSNDRVLIADSGVSQQILVFTPGAGNKIVESTIGVKGGILADPRGMPGPMRFNGLSGIGVDAKNNLYVAENGAGLRPAAMTGTTLESYSPDGKRRWSVDGLLWVDGADVDRSDPETIYSNMQRFKMDYARPPGKEWRWDGTLTDRFKYPESLMLHRIANSAPMIRKLHGHSFLFTTDMYSHALGIYRFDARDGTIAIPSGMISRQTIPGDWPRFQPKNVGWLWRDADGNGAFGQNEYTADPDGVDVSSCAGWWVDSDGGIWEARGTSRIRYLPFQGLDSHGNPMYDLTQAKEFDLPRPFTQVNRVQYDVDTDTLYVAGYTTDAAYSKETWKEAGKVMARYDGWLRGGKKHRYNINLPWNVAAKPIQTIMSVYQEGDYIFAVEPVLARVHVYDSATGREIGLIVPGKEVGAASGWVDTTQGISAYRRPDGEYLIFVEEDARAKVLMYRWKP
ncbi:hypothetical protein OVY01_21840 [Robbsia sp. Bb-Pol-6]|uniref:SMP-30/Gluconolactonase/LRE-like region domain-containing protein n=1 Tax=Robbsia betulipollinis TaxID=2981849 RepID=A0ABT3ZTI4_9BURK|nr:hypothetical protein [Robbsia betulipollinis]MCY0389787.1 hypothetical protein [Robbsia betulipollinis]